MDTRVYMYRKGEAKIFASPEEVPAGEGWQDTPVPDDAEPEVADDPAPKRRGRPPKTPESDQQ